MLTTLLSFAFVLGVLIFVHELGHFVTAKMVGIKVETFSLGFPPRAFGFKYGDTDYCISWLPLGGYVKMAGMIDESLDDQVTGAPWEYASKPVWQRVLVISAGSMMNFITAILILGGIAYSSGIGDMAAGALVSETLPETPASAVGILPEDVIISIDEQRVETAQDLIQIVNRNAGNQLAIRWERQGQILESKITPELDTDRDVGLIGIKVGTKVLYRDAGLLECIQYGAINSYKLIVLTAGALKMIITGEESFRDSVGGPIIIAKLAGESARRGFEALLSFTAFISLNLAFFNMLPFPVLDGGHLVMLLIEGVMRKPIPVKATLMVQKIGMAFLLALMIFILFNDISRWNQ